MGPICCPEKSVRNYHYALRNIPEERRYQRWRSTERHQRLPCVISDRIPEDDWRTANTWPHQDHKEGEVGGVSVLTTLLFVMQRGFTLWQGLCFAYCVCLSVITTVAQVALSWHSAPVQVLVVPAQRPDTEVRQCAGFQPRLRSVGLRAGRAHCVRADI